MGSRSSAATRKSVNCATARMVLTVRTEATEHHAALKRTLKATVTMSTAATRKSVN